MSDRVFIGMVFGMAGALIGAYLAAKAKGREKEMIFVGVDGLPGKEGGIATGRVRAGRGWAD